MAIQILFLFMFAINVNGAPDNTLKPLTETNQPQKLEDEKGDLKAASSSYSRQYTDWGGRYPGGYEFSVTGYGILEDRSGANYGDIGGYNNVGNSGGPNYSPGGYGGYKGYDGFTQSGHGGGQGGYGYGGGYGRNTGYGGNNVYPGNSDQNINGIYRGYGGYSSTGGYGGSSSYGGNGGYGGYGGNGGLSSYYGYNNPYYQGNNHLGYGYYNKRPGYGNIYNSGITPSLVAGYRGYSR